jgi:uncharacterized membrane protein YhaH (DUF805 family)
MDWTWYLFGFKGRINRAKMWLSVLIVLCWMLFLSGLAVASGIVSGKEVSFGFDIDDIFRVVDPASWRSLSSAYVSTLLVKAIGTSLFVWVYFATSIKRLHDRDKSGYWMVPFFVAPGLYNQFVDRLPDSWLDLPLALIAFALCIWGFVEIFCLKGSRKTNRFGPNPLMVDTRPRWEQSREIEMVPHKAGAHFPKFAFPRGNYLSRTSESNGH